LVIVSFIENWKLTLENYKTGCVSYPHKGDCSASRVAVMRRLLRFAGCPHGNLPAQAGVDGVLGTQHRGCFFGIGMATGHPKHIACFSPPR